MNRILMCFGVLLTFFCSPVHCEEKTQSIRLDISIVELAEKNGKTYGIEQSALYTLLVQKFASDGITVKDDPNLPYFALHVKSLPTAETVSTFLLGSFYQEATILQPKREVWAITWYQTSVVIGAKDKYTANIEQEATNIVQSFILDARQKNIL
jgi:hypothetical protein